MTDKQKVDGMTHHAVGLYIAAERKRVLLAKAEKRLDDWLAAHTIPKRELDYYVETTEDATRKLREKNPKLDW